MEGRMGKYRVLLVDDEEELVTTLVERLEFRGIEAEATTSGHEALELLGRKSFQVAVIDLKMPGLSGLEVLEVIRRRYPEMKVLLTTGHGSTGEPDEAMPQNAFDILLKPFNIDALIERIHAALGK
jgi:DNA-binding NtrC family response regulator